MTTPSNIIGSFVGNPNPATMSELIRVFAHIHVTDEDVADLAIQLADSGERLPPMNQMTADVPSTGGPSSLSTLICPLQLVSQGAVVPKMAVPGRPAGGVDVLACLDGFRPNLSTVEITRCLKACGYAHFLADDRFAPLDAALFAYRKSTDSVNVPPLAIASLLSKKLAAGVSHVTLDVRVAPHTNFGSNWEDARKNARRFIRVARHLSIRANCLLTDAASPYQPFIGRGESLLALDEVFSDRARPELTDHVKLCAELSKACTGAVGLPSTAEIKQIFFKHLEQQGSSFVDFSRTVQKLRSQPTKALIAKRAGYLRVDLDGIRRVLVSRQIMAPRQRELFPDPCGVVLEVPVGDYVGQGDAVARIRSMERIDELAQELEPFVFQSTIPQQARRAAEVVDA